MIGYLGTPGALVALPYRGGLDTSSDRPAAFVKTLGGKRKAFMGRRSRREWGVDFDLLSSLDAAGLVEVARSAGEVMWYPADAVAGNMFSPQASGWEATPGNVSDAGLVALPDGTVARSVAPTGGASSVVNPGAAHGAYEMVPVRPGEPVSVGAWGFSGLRFTGFWRDAAKGSPVSWATAAHSFSGWGWREEVLTPPAGASFLQLALSGGTQYARPSASWGNTAQDRPGRGCPKAVVHGLSEGLTTIAQDDAYGSIGVTITEVG